MKDEVGGRRKQTDARDGCSKCVKSCSESMSINGLILGMKVDDRTANINSVIKP